MSDGKRANVYFSKAKYKEFNDTLDEMFVGNGMISADVKDALMACLCDVFKYDPEKSSKTERVKNLKNKQL